MTLLTYFGVQLLHMCQEISVPGQFVNEFLSVLMKKGKIQDMVGLIFERFALFSIYDCASIMVIFFSYTGKGRRRK